MKYYLKNTRLDLNRKWEKERKGIFIERGITMCSLLLYLYKNIHTGIIKYSIT